LEGQIKSTYFQKVIKKKEKEKEKETKKMKKKITPPILESTSASKSVTQV